MIFPSTPPRLLEAHVFSFVIGRAFVTDVEKLRIHSKGRSLRVADVIGFFSDITEVCIFIVYIL
jgi:WD repeat and FYVE domain-containing protein 3